jgi:hypothetical protein
MSLVGKGKGQREPKKKEARERQIMLFCCYAIFSIPLLGT